MTAGVMEYKDEYTKTLFRFLHNRTKFDSNIL